MKNSIFWHTMSRIPLKINRRFGGICHIHLQDRRIRKQETNVKGEAGFMLGLFCYIEDGGDMFLRNVG
jgi:hypothetical protein